MQQDYYKEYYDLERNHWWFVAREKIISNFIKKLITDKYLESVFIVSIFSEGLLFF